MTTVGQIEKRTQARVIALFQDRLGYDYLGDKTDLDYGNIEQPLLTAWLTQRGVSNSLIARALHELNKAANSGVLGHDEWEHCAAWGHKRFHVQSISQRSPVA